MATKKEVFREHNAPVSEGVKAQLWETHGKLNPLNLKRKLDTM